MRFPILKRFLVFHSIQKCLQNVYICFKYPNIEILESDDQLILKFDFKTYSDDKKL